MLVGSLGAPVVVVVALGLAQIEAGWAPYAGVLVGYGAGVLAARFDVGVGGN